MTLVICPSLARCDHLPDNSINLYHLMVRNSHQICKIHTGHSIHPSSTKLTTAKFPSNLYLKQYHSRENHKLQIF
jgi:hypothetical protein